MGETCVRVAKIPVDSIILLGTEMRLAGGGDRIRVVENGKCVAAHCETMDGKIVHIPFHWLALPVEGQYILQGRGVYASKEISGAN